MSVTLVATDDSGKIPGIDAEQAADCAFMHDPTVRAWIVGQRQRTDLMCRIVIADDWWVNPGGVESLTFPVHPRDAETIDRIRSTRTEDKEV